MDRPEGKQILGQPRHASEEARSRSLGSHCSRSESDDEHRTPAKRRKLDLSECRKCREIRKKCSLESRLWPQKCDQCIHRGSGAVEALEPRHSKLNSQERMPNPPEVSNSTQQNSATADRRNSHTKERYSHDSADDKDLSKLERNSDLDPVSDNSSSSDNSLPYDRPVRTSVAASATPVSEHKHQLNGEEYYPSTSYVPLGRREFRILQLAPGKREDNRIACSFIITSMDRPVKYEAISYLWGGPDQKVVDIHVVDTRGRPHPVSIRSHLYEALRNLRHPKKVRNFWVDALCINYGGHDVHERNSQVAMKRYIFRNAENLCFWLGEEKAYSIASNFIPRILDLRNIDKLVRDDKMADEWVAFVTLLKNSVFSRLWMVQEVSVAPSVTLHCGQAAVHYGDFVDAVAIFASARAEISHLLRRSQKNHHDLQDRRVTMAERFVDISTTAFRPSSIGTSKRLLSLESLVSHLSELSSTNPLDRIYSVLALASDGPRLDEKTLMLRNEGTLRIDYEAKVVDVYQKFVLQAIKNSNSLDIICRHWVGDVSAADWELPTWTCPLQSSLQPTGETTERVRADSLVDLPGHSRYNASRGIAADFYVRPPEVFDRPKSLFVHGLSVDTIAKLGPRAEDGILLQEWLQLGRCDAAKETAPEEFWRTLVADRAPHGSPAPSWYGRAFLYCLHLSPTGNINTNRIIAESDAEPSLVIDFLQRVQSVIWNRKFLVSGTKRYMGLAPVSAQVGDLICVLHGCSVPVLLRPRISTDGGSYFQFVGECYVHGIMDGEAMSASSDKEMFELR